MNVFALQTSSPSLAAQPWTGGANATDFNALLNPRDGATDRSKQTIEQKVRKAAEQLTASSLVLPVLAQSHKDPFKSDLFHGGQAEDMFQSQLDTIMADRITSSSHFPIVDSIYKKIMVRAGKSQAKNSATQPTPGGLNIHG